MSKIDHPRVLNADGSLNRAEIKRIADDGAISRAIDNLNEMWGNRRYKGFFSICDVQSAFSALGRNYKHFSTEDKYLTTLHCKDWHSISPATRDGIAAIILTMANHKRLGYDRVTEEWFDVATRPNIIEVKPSPPLALPHEVVNAKSVWERFKDWLFKK